MISLCALKYRMATLIRRNEEYVRENTALDGRKTHESS